MRLVTRQVAFDPKGWSPQRAAEVAALFDSLAPEWHTRDTEGRMAPLEDAVARGGALPAGRWLEVGSGTGLVSSWLAARCQSLICLDLSLEMLRRAAGKPGDRVQADAAHLPLPDHSMDVAVLVNAMLFPAEIDRVLAGGGAVVWVSTSGDRTPIYLSAEDVALALGSGWEGVASEAAWGTWAVLRRR